MENGFKKPFKIKYMTKTEKVIVSVIGALVFIALVLQLVFTTSYLANKHQSITTQGRAMLGITW
jgi:hypothetical protein